MGVCALPTSCVTSDAVSVAWTTVAGTAGAADFTPASGVVSFPIGVGARTVSVATTPDLLDEPDESLSLTLSGPSNALIADGAAVGTIVDDDPTPSLVVSDASGSDPFADVEI